jgi:hypothetical protein
MHDTSTPLKVAIAGLFVHASVAAYFILNLAEEATVPVAYLGLATSISGAFSFFALLFLLDRKIGGFGRKQLLYPAVKIIVPALVMAVFLYVPLHIRVNGEFVIDYIIDTRRALNLLFLTVAVASFGLAIYVFLTWWFKSEELKIFLRMVPDLRKIGRVLNFEESVDSTRTEPRP